MTSEQALEVATVAIAAGFETFNFDGNYVTVDDPNQVELGACEVSFRDGTWQWDGCLTGQGRGKTAQTALDNWKESLLFPI